MVNTKFKSFGNSKIELNNENSLILIKINQIQQIISKFFIRQNSSNFFKIRQISSNFFKIFQISSKKGTKSSKLIIRKSSELVIIRETPKLKLIKRVKKIKKPNLKKPNLNLPKNWLAGFIDGEGSFFIEKTENKTPGSRPTYRPTLSIPQNDPQLLMKIKKYFGCGSVTRKNVKAWHYRCRTTKDFKNFIIPRLEGAPFQTVKGEQLNLLIEGISFLDGTKNFDETKIQTISEKIRELKDKTNYITQNPIDRDWFLGFFEAEGNFYFDVYKNKRTDQNEIRIAFKVTQKNRDLIEKIKNFWGFGRIQSEGRTRNIWKYNVEGINNVINYGMKIFETIPFKGKKNLERVKFLKIIRILITNRECFVPDYSTRDLDKLRRLKEGILRLRD